RSVDKDPTLALPPELRATFARSIIQDQISSAHPGGPLVVAPLLDAAGVLHAEPRLVALPDDARLAGFDCVHAGMLGMIEERPTEPPDNEPGFAGAAELASTKKLFEHLENDADHRIDSRAFLAARLMDVFIGDWDRHHDQWRWARFDSGGVHWWRPIPRDRDQAFARLDGVLVWVAGFYQPQLIGFGEDYPSIWRITYSGRVAVRLSRPGAAPYFRRTFDRRETEEVRLYLHGGDDRLAVRGSDGSGPVLRVIGGAGDDELADSSRGGRTWLYDDRGDNRFT